MKVLIDECAPKALKGFLSKHGHESLTVQEAAWSGKENGESWQKQKLNLTCWSPWIQASCINKTWQDTDSPLWFSNHPPIALNTSGSTFRPLLWPSRRSSPGRSFRTAALTEAFDANSDAQNADRPRVRRRNQPVLLPR